MPTAEKGMETIMGIDIEFYILEGESIKNPYSEEQLSKKKIEVYNLINRYTKLKLEAMRRQMDGELFLLEYYDQKIPKVIEQCGVIVEGKKLKLLMLKSNFMFVRGFSPILGDDIGKSAKMSMLTDFAPIKLSPEAESQFENQEAEEIDDDSTEKKTVLVPMLPFDSYRDFHIPESICFLIHRLEKNKFIYRLYIFHLAKEDEFVLVTCCTDNKLRIASHWGQAPISFMTVQETK